MPRLAAGTSILLAAGGILAWPFSAIALNSNCSMGAFQLASEFASAPQQGLSDSIPATSLWQEPQWHDLTTDKAPSDLAKTACLSSHAVSNLAESTPSTVAAIPEPGAIALLPNTPAINTVERLSDSSTDLEFSNDLALPALTSPLPAGPVSEQFSKPETEEPPIGDPELGILRLREDPLPVIPKPPTIPVVYLLGRVDYLSSDNIFLNEVSPIGDAFVRPSATLLALPPIGPHTWLVASADVRLLRYRQIDIASYDELQLQFGVRHLLFPQTYGQINWSNQQLYRAGFSDQFFNSHSLDLAIWRYDQLLPKLTLNSYYQARFSFSDPDEFSRITQFLGASVFYQVAPRLQAGLSYQLNLSDFTQQARFDAYHQLTAQAIYYFSASTRLRLFGGFSFGDSSDSDVNFHDTLLGITFDFDLPLF
ncbi:hypothetical protein [Almyronema epifaneia]|uniref:Uncharacterized protein n=1 Tax=Almyronema epifaneia S1 TaxID=2991925 RepID=A0ABW6IF19_9CYAN